MNPAAPGPGPGGAKGSSVLRARLYAMIRELGTAGEPWPGTRAAAERLGCGRELVRKALEHLEEKGLVERQPADREPTEPLVLEVCEGVAEQEVLPERIGRRCLCCRGEFEAPGRFIRVCRACKASSEYGGIAA